MAALVGIIRCAPALQARVQPTMAMYWLCWLASVASPSMPRPIRPEATTAMFASPRKKSTPASTATMKPGNSRGSSRSPRCSAVMWNVSLR